MKVISILNLKGGVGKTFTAYNMAYELDKRGYKVICIDNDKQGNLSKAFSRYNATGTCNTAKMIYEDWRYVTDIVKTTDYINTHIISANMTLLSATYDLTFRESEEQHMRYKKFIEFANKEAAESYIPYDFCIIDNPPDIALNVINALAITDQVIVPVKIDEWALEGLDIVSEQINEAKAINPKINLLGALVTIYRNNEANIAGLEWLEQKSGIKVLGKIRYSAQAEKCTFFNKPVYEYSPCSAAAQDYKRFVTDYLKKWR